MEEKTLRHPMTGTVHFPTVCTICGQSANPYKHPCLFERACSCWRGIPCNNPS